MHMVFNSLSAKRTKTHGRWSVLTGFMQSTTSPHPTSKKAMRNTFTLLLLLFLCTNVRAQRCVKGIVMDHDDFPLIGASIQIKGTSTGVVADIDGKFSVCATQNSFTLVVSYTGFETLTITVKADQDDLQFRLAEAAANLNEVVVTALGVRKEKKALGYVATSISMSNMNGRARRRGKRKRDRPAEPIRPGSYNKITPNAFISTQEEPISTLSTDVDRAAYANIRGFLNRGQLPPKDAVRIEEMINYFPYSRAKFGLQDPVRLGTEIITCPWNSEAQLLRVTAETSAFATDTRKHELLPDQQPSNLVFLVDVSGSMQGPGRLPLVKQSLRMLTRQLSESDRVSLVVYAGAAGLVLPPTPGNDTTAIFSALDRLTSGGSTAGGAGIKLAYKTAKDAFVEGGNNRVIIATDGDFNVGISSQDKLIKMVERQRESGVFLTVLGFGTGNYQEGMMQELADRGNGSHAYIDQPAEAHKVLIEEFGGTIYTVAKDVKLQLVFNPEYISGYRLIGYENRLLATEDFDDDTKDAAEMGAGHQVTVLYELIPTKSYTSASYIGYLKMRYKPAAGGRSRKNSFPIAADALPDELATKDIQWAAAVAEFGMLLRASSHKGSADWDQLLSLAKANVGTDPGGYRQEMISLIRKAQKLIAKR